MNLKEQMERDIREVFHNTDDFAEYKEIYYDGDYYTVPVIIDYEGIPRKKTVNDHVDGIYRADAKLYVAYSDLGCMPRIGAKLEVDDNIFTITKVAIETGEIILDLEMLDE